jgi:hypothetical protein
MTVRGVLLAACCLMACVSFGLACTQVSASVRMLTDVDYKFNCYLSLDKIKNQLKATTVNFIITKFWIDENQDQTPDYFCVRLGRHPCKLPTQNDTDEYVRQVAGCLKKADDLGFTKIQITPHLDDGNVTAAWRNKLFLDPLQNYGGQSYQEFHINPLLSAIKAAKVKAQMYFSLQGEMNYGVLRFPEQWEALAQGVRDALPGVKVGLNNNYNDACGADWNMNSCGAINGAAVGSMYNSMDYVGISAYHGIPVGFGADQLSISASGFSQVLKAASGYGLDDFLKSGEGKEIHYSEFGIGGSSCNPQGQANGGCLTNDPGTIAQYPYWGMGSSYKKEQDPWTDYPQNKAFATYFYTQAVTFAGNDGSASWPVKQIYIWAYGSYDVVAVHPMSTTGYGTWLVPEVLGIIADHNDKCPV